jgi:DNA transposition AAA+ family ATPase
MPHTPDLQTWEQSLLRLGADIVAEATAAAYKAEVADLVRWFHGYLLAERRRTWKLCCDQIGLDHVVVWRAFNGTADDAEQRRFMGAVGPFREKTGSSKRSSYAPTSFAARILAALDVALRRSERGDGGLTYIQGDAGVGKTRVSTGWVGDHNHGCANLIATRGVGGIKSLLGDIAVANGIDAASSYNVLHRRVFGCYYAGRVLIVDEAHLLVSEHSRRQIAVDALRRLSDITGCAVVLLVTDDRFEVGLAASGYNYRQLVRRCDRLVFLPTRPEDGDLVALCRFKAPGIECDDKLLAALRALTDHDCGGFGAVAKIIADAEDLAISEGRHLARKDVMLAAAKKLEAMDVLQKRLFRRR